MAWVIPSALLLGFIVFLYFFFSSNSDNGLVAVLSYFYQMVDLLFVQNSRNVILLHILSSLSNIQIGSAAGSSSSSRYSVCLAPGFDFKDVQFFKMAGTLTALAVPWFLVWVGVHWYRCCRRRCRPAGEAFFTSEEQVNELFSLRNVSTGRFAAVLLNIFLFSYASITRATFTLLQCVTIPGLDGGFFLFGDATVSCYSDWQRPLFALIVFAALVPVLLFFFVWSQRSKDLSNYPACASVFMVCSSFWVLSCVFPCSDSHLLVCFLSFRC
jgi:hypothetical protein